jgi:hypothetical protein
MFQDVPARHMEKTFELRSYSFKKMSCWTKEINPNFRDSILLKIGFQKSGSFFSYPDDDVFCKLASDGSQSLYCAQPVQEIWDCAKAQSWLDTCLNCYELICK